MRKLVTDSSCCFKDKQTSKQTTTINSTIRRLVRFVDFINLNDIYFLCWSKHVYSFMLYGCLGIWVTYTSMINSKIHYEKRTIFLICFLLVFLLFFKIHLCCTNVKIFHFLFVYSMEWIELKTLHMLDKHSTKVLKFVFIYHLRKC